MDIEIKISPFLKNCWYLALEDSFKFGVKEGTIYTPRLFNVDECTYFENKPNFYSELALSINHECLHLILLKLEGYNICKQLDNISKNTNNDTYLI